ncbi:type 1 glutamine amidotransferase [Paenibacillus xylaniclasticus]|uniref:type 1 glutamine amidotransferase n=1 Tax=Paenibacillus xylaniclasticus TaxID=588083 RepID=UPI0027D7E6F0|nr:type 1 glutamine amidotransferase [Paenibacillus xylaniclasticus]
MVKVLAFKHYDFDDPTAFEQWAEQNGHQLRITDPACGINIAWLADTDLLIICGGPMSAYDDDKYEWLREEKAFIRKAVEQGIKILGICLGAQMLAEILGGKAYRHSVKEIGWHLISRTEDSHPWTSWMPDQFFSFQWHGDTFELPPGARWLARSEACGHQAFAWGDRVVGLQFHLETTPSCIEQMMDKWADEMVDAPYIHSAERIRAGYSRSEESFRMLHTMLDQIAASS